MMEKDCYEKEEAFLLDTAKIEKDTPKRAGAPVPLPEKQPPMGARIFPLPEVELLGDAEVNFLELVELRASVREYTEESLSLKELSYLLWCTQGVKMPLPEGRSLRTVPGAGARHALETYLFVQRVLGLPPGFYRYLAYEHALLPLWDELPYEEKAVPFSLAFSSGRTVRASAVTLVWTAARERLTYDFGRRGYRYAFLDAGHACQNLYLAAQTIKLGVCALGAFDDAALAEVLRLDGEKEFPLYAASVGKR